MPRSAPPPTDTTDERRASVRGPNSSEERLRLAVDAGEVGVWDWDIAGNHVSWSDRVYAMHDMQPGTFGGRVEDFRSLVHPEDAQRVAAEMQRALAAATVATYANEFRTVLHDGRVRWISTRAHILRDEQGQAVRMVGASSDVTERAELLAAERAAHAAADKARGRLEILARAGAELSRSLEPAATLEAIATAIVPAVADWCRIDLLDEQGVLQRKVAYHIDPAKAQEAWEMVNRLRAAPTTMGSMGWAVENSRGHHGRFDEAPASRTDYARDPAVHAFAGTFGMGAYYILPLIARGRTLGSMGVIQAESGRDLSERDRALILELAQRAALALDNARLYAEAETARREAERANRAKDEFLAMLGHELRNPLAPITSALELLRARNDAGSAVEREVIERQVAHLTRLVDDLLDVSRVNTGKIQLQRARLDVKDVVARALELSQPHMERNAHSVQLSIARDAAFVKGDAVRLVQVVSNLLANAAKFTPREGHIALSLRKTGAQVEIEVEDSGSGIAPELLPRVFDAFVQGEQAMDREAGGLGLGLSIARMLVELHGGTIAAHSEGPGRGSRFTIRLPEDASADPARLHVDDRRQALPRGARVLLVDDNRDALETLTELLRMSGYDARSACDGPAALELIRTFTPDVALLDVGLPGMDGYELARRLRAEAGMPDLKLVALTGYGSERDRARAFAAEFHEHLVKPVSIERLLQVLGQLCEAAPSAAS